MIKPFKVLEVRVEPDGGRGVLYEVWKFDVTSANTNVERRMQAYMSVPAGEDIDDYLFRALSKGGWF